MPVLVDQDEYLLSARRLEKLRHIERVLSDENLDLFPDFTKKLSILRALEYTSDMDVVQLKGRVACEVNNMR